MAKLTKNVEDFKEIDPNLREVRETLAKLTKDVEDLKQIGAQLTKDAEDLKELSRRQLSTSSAAGKTSKDEEASGGDQNKGYFSS